MKNHLINKFSEGLNHMMNLYSDSKVFLKKKNHVFSASKTINPDQPQSNTIVNHNEQWPTKVN
jgi:hypothetical protein